MKVLIERLTDWNLVLNEARQTMGKDDIVKEPSSSWKRKILLSRHSPIQALKFRIRLRGIKYWISVHLVRHFTGITHWVSSQRDDRNTDRLVSRDDLPQSALVNHDMELNAQSIMTISRKRLCAKAADETRAVWQSVKDEMYKIGETELADCMMPECGWTGYSYCPEMLPCGRLPHLSTALQTIWRKQHITDIDSQGEK